jgi:zinc transport system ATP-binding protein
MQQIDHTKNSIEVEGVDFSYDGKHDVLSSITLGIHLGDYIGLIGPNGAGKTTLLKIMLGLLVPNKGTVRLFGEAIEDFKDWYKIGYVPQKTTNFDANFPVTVSEVVLMGRYGKRKLFHRMTSEDRRIAEKALQEVDMLAFADRLVGDLSGGQQQRVFIARALASEPEVIFMDEPTSGIDRDSEDGLYDLLRKLNRDLGLTLVLVSHDITRVTEEAMHIACIDRTLSCYLTPQEYLASEQARGHMHI